MSQQSDNEAKPLEKISNFDIHANNLLDEVIEIKPETHPWTLYFDGSSKPLQHGNKIACYGWALKNHNNIVVKSGYGELEDSTVNNNTAEYLALLKSLETLYQYKIKISFLMIKGDSMIVVRQVSGTQKVSNSYLYKLRKQIKELLPKICDLWEIQWIPRKDNKDADELSHKFYQQNRKKLNSKKKRVRVNKRKNKKRRN